MVIPNSCVLVIDTEEYTGSFERFICAYLTGQVGECGVGSGVALAHQEEIVHLDWWTKHIVSEADERGVCRPASIWPTEGWYNNGSGGHFRDTPESDALAQKEGKKATKKYYSTYIAQKEKMIKSETYPGNWTREACKREIAEMKDKIDNYKAGKYPAYLSVAIFLDKLPPEDVWQEFMSRAVYFSQNSKKIEGWDYLCDFKITGFSQLEPQHKLREVKKIKV